MKKQYSLTLLGILLMAIYGVSGRFTQAQTLLLDFGNSSTPVTNATANNTPYSTGSWTASSWNTVTTSAAVNLKYTDGTTGATLTFGTLTNVANSTTVNFNSPGTVSNAGGTANSSGTGPYSSLNAPGTGFTFQNTLGNVPYTAIGVSIGGLQAGTYTIYLTGVNTNALNGASPTSAPSAFWATTSSTLPTTIDFSTLGTAAVAANTTGGLTSWTAGDNYVAITITLAEGEYLNLISTGNSAYTGSSSNLRGFLNLAEIVAIPEPTGMSLLLLSGSLGLVFWKQRQTR